MEQNIINDEFICNYGENRFNSYNIDVDTIYYEISGNCNAKCKYCSKGAGDFDGCRWQYITPDDFDKGINRLYDLEFLTDNVYLGLFNWGEPLLNPQILEILENLHNRDQSYGLSTNGSKYIQIPEKYFDNLDNFRFSLHGFSQNSYQYINKLSFKSVFENIEKWLKVLSAQTIEVYYFLYKFNYDEMLLAYEYFTDKGINLMIKMPIIADFYKSAGYLTNSLGESYNKDVEKDLYLEHVLNLLKTKTNGFICPMLTSELVIDEFNNILTCCSISKKSKYYSIGSLLDLNRDEIINRKKQVPICNGCMNIGLPYWLARNNELLPIFIQRDFTSGQGQNKLLKTKIYAYLYIDSSRGFNEREKEIGLIQQIDRPFLIEFNLKRYSNIKEVRFDPIEGQKCTLYLDKIEIIDSSNNMVSCEPLSKYQTNGNWTSNNSIDFKTTDPWIIIPTSDFDVKNIRISGIITIQK